MRYRLDQLLVVKKLAPTRSQAESIIRMGDVRVNKEVVTKPGRFFDESTHVLVAAKERYVSRAGLKLASVANALNLEFKDKIVLDVGSSTGGFTDYSLKHGAKKVIAVDVGTNQLHPSLRGNPAIDIREKTDIRAIESLELKPDIIVMDVSFVSVRELLPHIFTHLTAKHTEVIVMLKPQFEAGKTQVNKGVIKNDTIRRSIMKEFEAWVKRYALIADKSDSDVTGEKGNRERFYKLKLL